MRSALKQAERAVRRFLLVSLRVLSRKPRSEVPAVDFNACKVLFIRQDRIGDVLISTPIFSSLKSHYPNMILDVFLSRNNYFVLSNNPSVRKRWIYTKGLLATIKTLMTIRSERYDFVVDLMDNSSATSTVLMLLAGGKWNVGLEKDNAYVCDIVVPLKSRKESHIVERIAQLLSVFGIDPATEPLRLSHVVPDEARRQVDEIVGSGGKNLLGVNISAGSDTRFWGIQNYRELIRWLIGRFPSYEIALLAKPDDRERVMAISTGLERLIIPPEGSFDVFAAWIERLSLLISPDTSAVHLAAAFRIPSVILYVQSNTDLRIWEPYGSVSESLITTSDDLTAIRVQEVIAAVERIMNDLESKKVPVSPNAAHQP